MLALLLLIALADLVPARWTSADPASLELLKNTPINCLLVDASSSRREFIDAARASGIALFAMVQPGAELPTGFDGIVLEGDFPVEVAERVRKAARDSKLEFVELTSRARVNPKSADAVIGIYEGIWPGIKPEENTHAGPTSGPWIQTNGACLRSMRENAAGAVWIGVRPPEGVEIPVQRYMHAVADAAMAGGRWVVSLDSTSAKKLLAREAAALDKWARIGALLKYYEDHKEWRRARSFGQFALVQDASSGALYVGGIFDMIASRNTPVRPVLLNTLEPKALSGVRMAVNADPSKTAAAQREVLMGYARGGGSLLTAPPGWKLPAPVNGEFKLNEEEYKTLDEIWREVNGMINRRNLGVRLFNVSGMLSNFVAMPGGATALVHLVNYTDYPVESVTVHLLGKWKRAALMAPGRPSKELELYATDEGMGLDIDKIETAGTLVIE